MPSDSLGSALSNPVVYNLIYVLTVGLSYRLTRYHPKWMLRLIYSSTAVFITRFILRGNFAGENVGQLIKVLCIMPLGFGVVLMFRERYLKTRDRESLKWFTAYINFAVLGNIGMMVFAPIHDAKREISSRVTCCSLFVWLALQMRNDDWKTVEFEEQGLFLFKSSSLSWIVSHAVYRTLLITLPSFETLRYLMMEPLSLGIMYLLHGSNQHHEEEEEEEEHSSSAVTDYFGLADTLVVATTGMTSALIQQMQSSDQTLPSMTLSMDQSMLDAITIPIHSVLIVIAMRGIYSEWNKG